VGCVLPSFDGWAEPSSPILDRNDMTKLKTGESTTYETFGKLELPASVNDTVGCKSWEWWLSPGSPVEGPSSKRLKYADWISTAESRKGLYLWLYASESDGARAHRFLHVGIAAKGNSSLAERTKVHCRHQMDGTDPLYDIPCTMDRDQGRLVVQKDATKARRWNFLRQVRVLFLYAPKETEASAIQALEGWIAYSARMAFPEPVIDENGLIKDDVVDCEPRGTKLWTTNTLRATTRPKVRAPDPVFGKLRDAMNRCVPMLPDGLGGD
jgi:hypothetical protein